MSESLHEHAPSPQRAVSFNGRFLGFILLAGLLAAGGWLGYRAWVDEQQRLVREQVVAEQTKAAEELAAAEAAFGIKVERLSLSSAGYMLDFRYRVKDVDKAGKLMDQHVKPYVLTDSKARLEVPYTPTIGTLKQSTQTPKANHVYFALIANPARMVKSGDLVTLVMGEFKSRVKVQ